MKTLEEIVKNTIYWDIDKKTFDETVSALEDIVKQAHKAGAEGMSKALELDKFEKEEQWENEARNHHRKELRKKADQFLKETSDKKCVKYFYQERRV